MTDPDIIVIGGGAAGIAAAVEAGNSGLSVMLCEQRHALGGAIHRQPADGARAVAVQPSLAGRFQALSDALAASAVKVHLQRSFIGVDGRGTVLVEDRKNGHVDAWRPKVLIIAVGAVERVMPRPGWHLEGVVAAGGLQVMLKEGRVPAGRILLAGNGPLLLSLGAQLAAAGNPPVAVVEAGNPLAGFMAGFGLLRRPSILADVAQLLVPVLQKRFAWRRATSLVSIKRANGQLVAVLRDRAGREDQVTVDRIGLHDGLRPNAFGLPLEGTKGGVAILRAGDGREVLGAYAAELDGQRAGRDAVAYARGRVPAAGMRMLRAERALQASLGRLFQPRRGAFGLADCPDDTVICRCENRRIGDLKAQMQHLQSPSPRELKLNGRFAMGACQGRFCAEWALSMMATILPESETPTIADMVGNRWPNRPVAMSSLAECRFHGGHEGANQDLESAHGP